MPGAEALKPGAWMSRGPVPVDDRGSRERDGSGRREQQGVVGEEVGPVAEGQRKGRAGQYQQAQTGQGHRLEAAQLGRPLRAGRNQVVLAADPLSRAAQSSGRRAGAVEAGFDEQVQDRVAEGEGAAVHRELVVLQPVGLLGTGRLDAQPGSAGEVEVHRMPGIGEAGHGGGRAATPVQAHTAVALGEVLLVHPGVPAVTVEAGLERLGLLDHRVQQRRCRGAAHLVDHRGSRNRPPQAAGPPQDPVLPQVTDGPRPYPGGGQASRRPPVGEVRAQQCEGAAHVVGLGRVVDRDRSGPFPYVGPGLLHPVGRGPGRKALCEQLSNWTFPARAHPFPPSRHQCHPAAAGPGPTRKAPYGPSTSASAVHLLKRVRGPHANSRSSRRTASSALSHRLRSRNGTASIRS